MGGRDKRWRKKKKQYHDPQCPSHPCWLIYIPFWFIWFLAENKEQFLNPDYWHPKCKNFEIIDWDKFLAKDPSVPKRFNPPQRKLTKFLGAPPNQTKFGWWKRSTIGAPDLSEGVKTQIGKIDDPNLELFRGLLGLNPDSSKVPEPFRNCLLWMENN